MQTRRLLFVRPPRGLRLMPIYLALVTLAVFGLIGFVLAFWPVDRAPSSFRGEHREAEPAVQSVEGGTFVQQPSPRERGRGTWM